MTSPRSRARFGWTLDIRRVWHRYWAPSLRCGPPRYARRDSRGGSLHMSCLNSNFYFRRGFQQTSGVGMLRAFGDLLGGSYLHNLAAIHHRNARREIAHDRHRVRNEQISQAEVALQLRQQIDDLRAHADVERGDGFVGHDKFGTQRQRARDADALPLASAEFVREAPPDRFVEANGAQEFDDAALQPTLSQSTRQGWGALFSMNDERLGDDVLDAEAGIERGEGILEDDLHIAAQPPHFAGAGGEQVAAFEADAARSRLKEPQNQPSQRALARSRFAHQSESFASLNVERNIVHGANFT